MSALTLRLHTAADLPAILQLHRAAFPVGERSAAHVDWLHRNGAEIAVAMTADGRCVGMWGGLRRRLWLEQREQPALLGMDVAVAAEMRSGLRAGRLLVQLAELHTRSGLGCRVAWGYPQPGLLRTVLRHVGYEVLGDVYFLVREVSVRRPVPLPEDLSTGLLTRVDEGVDRLWARCRGDMEMAVVRDRLHWDSRFLAHPSVRYDLVAVRSAADGGLRGLAAVRSGGVHADVLSIVDWLVPAGDLATATALLSAIEAIAAAREHASVVAWFRPGAAPFASFQREHGFRVVGSPYQIAFLPLSAGMARVRLAEQWFQTMADMDFF